MPSQKIKKKNGLSYLTNNRQPSVDISLKGHECELKKIKILNFHVSLVCPNHSKVSVLHPFNLANKNPPEDKDFY